MLFGGPRPFTINQLLRQLQLRLRRHGAQVTISDQHLHHLQRQHSARAAHKTSARRSNVRSQVTAAPSASARRLRGCGFDSTLPSPVTIRARLHHRRGRGSSKLTIANPEQAAVPRPREELVQRATEQAHAGRSAPAVRTVRLANHTTSSAQIGNRWNGRPRSIRPQNRWNVSSRSGVRSTTTGSQRQSTGTDASKTQHDARIPLRRTSHSPCSKYACAEHACPPARATEHRARNIKIDHNPRRLERLQRSDD